MSPVTLVFLSTLTVTSYRSVPKQTDGSPFVTSIGYRVSETGIAVSQDLLKSGLIKYGDGILVEGVGLRICNDTMHERWRNRMDVWVPTYDDEKRFDAKFKGKKLRVWVIRQKTKSTSGGER